MAAAIVFLLIVVVIGGIAINLYLRGWVRDESRREAHLRDPDTHTVAYAIPNGVDPATSCPRWREPVSPPGSTASAWSSASASSATSRSVSRSAASSKASR